MRENSNYRKNQTSTKERVVIYLIGLVLSGYFGLLCGAVWLEGNTITEFINNFNTFIIEQKHFIVGLTPASGKFVLAYILAWTCFYLIEITKVSHPYAGEEFGRAKWGDEKKFSRQYADHKSKNLVKIKSGDEKDCRKIWVNTANYWLAENVYISIHNNKTTNLNILVVGPPGSGKTYRLVKPVLSGLCGNFIVTDPKGELYRETAQFFEDNGYEVMVMNVESEEAMAMSIHFNPFEYIRNESDIMSIAAILMKATTPPDSAGSGKDRFFEESAESLLTSIIYLIHYYYPKEHQNWVTFVKLLDATCVYTQKDGVIDNRDDGILSIEKRAQKAWKDQGKSGDFPGFKNVEKLYNGAPETTSSIVATLDAHCRYMKLQCVTDLLSEDEVRIAESFGYAKPCAEAITGKRILYIVTSEDKRYYDWIPSMVYALFFDELYHLTSMDPEMKGSLPQHLTFLMDEFSNVTLPDSFVEKLSTMRSRNMSAIIILQNLIQLKRKFPQYDMDKDLIGNCSIIDILGAPDMDSCEYLSKHFGNMTIHKASDSVPMSPNGQSSRTEDVIQKPLFPAEEIFAMKKDGDCAMVIKGTEPLRPKKCNLAKTGLYPLLCRKSNPYDPTNRIVQKRSQMQDQKPLCLVDDSARTQADGWKGQGKEIRHLSEQEVNAVALRVAPKPYVPSTEDRKRMAQNAERYQRKKQMSREITLEEFQLKDKRQDKEYSEVKCFTTARSLGQKGFSNYQIRMMKPLIMKGEDAGNLTELFSPNTPPEEIERVTAQMVSV